MNAKISAFRCLGVLSPLRAKGEEPSLRLRRWAPSVRFPTSAAGLVPSRRFSPAIAGEGPAVPLLRPSLSRSPPLTRVFSPPLSPPPQLISFAFRRCRASDDLCRVSVALAGSPVVRISGTSLPPFVPALRRFGFFFFAGGSVFPRNSIGGVLVSSPGGEMFLALGCDWNETLDTYAVLWRVV